MTDKVRLGTVQYSLLVQELGLGCWARSRPACYIDNIVITFKVYVCTYPAGEFVLQNLTRRLGVLQYGVLARYSTAIRTEEVSYSEWLAGRSPRWLQVGLLGCVPGPAGES